MKKQILWALSLGIFLASCSHNSPSYQNTKWMDQEDYVRYVNFFSRAPSNVGSTYHLIGDCDGLPSIDVKTAPGFCVGLLYDGLGLRKPRTAATIDSHQIVLTDMGSWELYDGKIFILNFDNGQTTLKEIFSNKSFSNLKDPRREIINRPHQITKHTDGYYYVGSSTAILRFNPLATNPLESIEVLIKDLPAEGLHPLKSFAFDESGSLFVNVGAATNVCHKNSVGSIFGNRNKTCDEAENREIGQGQIRRYKINNNGSVADGFEIYAKGLRNSVALTWDSKRQVLIQGENSRDTIEKNAPHLSGADLPHDEINLIEQGKHYGWPYCYDNNQSSPEWKQIKCGSYQKPQMLLPAHSAPLSLHVYNGSMFPEWYQGRMFAALHGYEPHGHRLVTFKRDDKGLPTGVPQSVVYGWDSKGEQKYGSPVGITELPDGSMIIIEDMNKKILRLAYDPSLGDGKPVQEIENTHTDINIERANAEETRRLKLLKKLAAGNSKPFTLFQTRVIDKTCYVCHGGENAPGIQLLRYDDEGNDARILKAKKASEVYSMVSGVAGFPPMPPQGFSSEEEAREASNLLKLWIEQISQN
ncbi:MAG: PQQ-dependent sugar dehydrogenase [Bacteriovorax sp.]|nr:PQQ-dependent sugar dehydrogenase [Bacteriovorax sp.]